jgi:hypothetical protein
MTPSHRITKAPAQRRNRAAVIGRDDTSPGSCSGSDRMTVSMISARALPTSDRMTEGMIAAGSRFNSDRMTVSHPIMRR